MLKLIAEHNQVSEEQRLRSLHQLKIQYQQPDSAFDTMTRLLTSIFKTSEAYVSFVDRHIVYYKSHTGTSKTQAKRDESFCSVAILSPEVTVFEDIANDPLFTSNQHMHQQGAIRFYAAAPLITADGSRIGAVCVADHRPRKFTNEDREILVDFANLAMQQLTKADPVTPVEVQPNQKLQQMPGTVTMQQVYKLIESVPMVFAVLKGPAYIVELANQAAQQILGKGPEIIGRPLLDVVPDIEAQGFKHLLDEVQRTGVPYQAKEAPLVLFANDHLKTVYFNFVYQPLYEADGSILSIMAFAIDVTEQVEARKKIEDSEKRLRNVLEQSLIPMLVFKGPDLVVDIVNRPMADLWEEGKLQQGKKLLEILPKARHHYYYDLLLNVMQMGKTHYEHETPAWFRHAHNSEERFCEFVYQPFEEADGSISGVIVIASEVTEQVISRRKLLESENNFRTLVMQAPVGICILEGKDFTAIEANHAFLTMLGRNQIDFLNQPLWQSIPEMKTSDFDKILQQVLKSGNRYSSKETPVHVIKNGQLHEVFVDFLYEPLKEKDGTIKKLLVLAIDVTDKVLGRMQLENLEERARLAIESAELGTYEVDLQTNAVQVSDRIRSLFDLQEISERNQIARAIHPDDLPRRAEAYQVAYQTGRLEYEGRVLRNDSSVTWIKAQGVIKFEDGRPSKLYGVIQDITKQKLFAEELAKQVKDRTRELSIANQELQNLNIELEEFAYAASHDMQEPLRKVQTFSSMLLEHAADHLDERSKTFLTKIGVSVARMKTIIESLLEYSRQSREHKQLVETNLNKIVEEIENDLELYISEKQATITTNVLPIIKAVPGQINQLFYNIIINSLKFSKPGVPVNIQITCAPVSDALIESRPLLKKGIDYIQLSFTDNGIGFEQEHADKIFSLFKRLHGRSEYEGTGIGLALCKKIALNHQGDIFASSSPEKGATFTVILPAK